MAREDFRFFYPWRVRWFECDAQRIVFNGAYLNYQELAMSEYFRYLGVNVYKEPEAGTFDMVSARTTIEYKAPVHVEDMIEIGVKVTGMGNTSMSLVQEVFREGEADVCTLLETLYVFVNPRTLRPIPIPPELRRLIEHYEATGEILPAPDLSYLRSE